MYRVERVLRRWKGRNQIENRFNCSSIDCVGPLKVCSNHSFRSTCTIIVTRLVSSTLRGYFGEKSVGMKIVPGNQGACKKDP